MADIQVYQLPLAVSFPSTAILPIDPNGGGGSHMMEKLTQALLISTVQADTGLGGDYTAAAEASIAGVSGVVGTPVVQRATYTTSSTSPGGIVTAVLRFTAAMDASGNPGVITIDDPILANYTDVGQVDLVGCAVNKLVEAGSVIGDGAFVSLASVPSSGIQFSWESATATATYLIRLAYTYQLLPALLEGKKHA